MAQAEVVTVRMSRGNLETPWGFDIVPPLTICNVVGGSLADRAGLLSGDTLVELEGHENLDLTLARQLLSKAQHKVELVVHRTGSEVHRIWKPSITENTEYNRFQHSVHNVGHQDAINANRMGSVPSNTPTNVPLKVSLEHHNQESVNIPGFNVTAQPYGAHQEVKHLQYNSPMPLYSPQSAAEQYLQQTGGLFGTDPNLTKMKETPSYLRSETLRLIQESEQAKDESSRIRSVQAPSTRDGDARPATQKASTLPQCFLCGRNILGVMCRAFDRTLHAECFQCATCGSSLKNQGHHFVNEKFYCDVHGRQLKGRDEFRSTTLRPQGTIGGGSQTVTSTRKTQENVRAFYQPDIMARRPLSISPTPWKTQSPISPSNRGVPSSATHYGQDLRNESYSSSTLTHQSNGSVEEHSPYAIPHHVPLPPQIREATSPRRRPSIRSWPPSSNLTVKKFWRFHQHSASVKSDRQAISLLKYINELDKEKHRPPSPKTNLLRGDTSIEVEDKHNTGAKPVSRTMRVIREVFPSERRAARENQTAPTFKTSEVEKLSRSKELLYVPIETKSSTQSQASSLIDECEQRCAQSSAILNTAVIAENDVVHKLESRGVPLPPARRSLSTITNAAEHVSSIAEKQTECLHNGKPHTEDSSSTVAWRKSYCANIGDPLHVVHAERSSAGDSRSLLTLVSELREREVAAERLWSESAGTVKGRNLDVEQGSIMKDAESDVVWSPDLNVETAELMQESADMEKAELDEPREKCVDGKNENVSLTSLIQNDNCASMKDSEKVCLDDVTNNNPGNRKNTDVGEILRDTEEEKRCISEDVQHAAAEEERCMTEDVQQVATEEERCISEDVQQVAAEEEKTTKLEREHLQGMHLLGELDTIDQIMQRAHITRRTHSRAVLAKQRSEEAERQRDDDIARIELFRQRNIERLTEISEAIWQNDSSAGVLVSKHCADVAESPKLSIQEGIDENSAPETISRQRYEVLSEEEKKREEQEARLRDENDRRIAIESIERHQRQLHEQQEQLSQLLDNAIAFLRNLDTDVLRRSPESSSYEGMEEASTMQRGGVSMAFEGNKQAVEQGTNLLAGDSPTAEHLSEGEAVEINSESCKQSMQERQYLETPAERIVRAIRELSEEHSSSTNKFVKTTSTTQQHIRQGDDSARGRGTLQAQGNRVPFCEHCKQQIRGAYVLATGLAWCPEHFVCANKACNRRLLDIGFVEDKGQKYCEQCFENLIAPHCAKCSRPITADCLNALQKQWHPQCFVCAHCHKPFGNSAFFLEQGLPYCEADWNALFTTKCVSCHYPIEAGDRWVEALGSAFHSNCFNCTSCNVNLEGESFYAKNGAPYCKLHA